MSDLFEKLGLRIMGINSRQKSHILEYSQEYFPQIITPRFTTHTITRTHARAHTHRLLKKDYSTGKVTPCDYEYLMVPQNSTDDQFLPFCGVYDFSMTKIVMALVPTECFGSYDDNDFPSRLGQNQSNCPVKDDYVPVWDEYNVWEMKGLFVSHNGLLSSII